MTIGKIDKSSEIKFILKDFLKVIKVVSMYPEDNPLPASLRRSFSEKLETVIEEFGDMRFTVEENCIKYEDEIAYESKSEEDNLSRLFFDAGITQFTFADGLDVEEIYKILDIFKEYINSPAKDIDLVAMIWEAGVTRIQFRTLEDAVFSNYDENFDIQEFLASKEFFTQEILESDDFSQEEYQKIFENEIDLSNIPQTPPSGKPIPSGKSGNSGKPIRDFNRTGRTVFSGSISGLNPTATMEQDDDEVDELSLKMNEAANAMGFGDIDTSVSVQKAPVERPDTSIILNDEFKLSQEEEEQIRQLNKIDSEFDPYLSIANLLKEMLLQESDMQSFFETVTVCEKVMNEFVGHGKLSETTQILKFMKKLGTKILKEKPLWNERLKDAISTSSSAERLQNLVTALNFNDDISEMELKMYFENFSWEAIRNITDIIGKVENENYRKVIIDHLINNGSDHIDIISRGLFEKNENSVISTISVLSQMPGRKSHNYLIKMIDHKSLNVRLALVSSLKTSKDELSIDILKHLVKDPIGEVRKEAAAALISHKNSAAFNAMTEIINEEDFFNLDGEDQTELLKTYSIIGSEYAVTYLGDLICKYNLFRDHQLSHLRTAAFNALKYNQSEKCERLLLKLAKSFRPDIKNQAQACIRERRTLIFGGDQ